MLAVDVFSDYDVDSRWVVNDALTGARVTNPANGHCSLSIDANTEDSIQETVGNGTDTSVDIDNAIISTLRHFLKWYTNYEAMNDREGVAAARGAGALLDSGPIVSGGLQQYLIRNAQKVKLNDEQPRKGAGSDCITFHDLPDSLQLYVLSFVEAKDLCRIATVCHHWLMLSSDDLLWKRLLSYDVKKWHVIGHTSNPRTYQECQSDWSHKEIYLRCSPEVNRRLRQQNSGFHQLSSLLRSFWPKRIPRIAMFGPGLESDTRALTRKILQEKTGLFEATGMFPGQSRGVGSGFTMKILSSGLCFNLMTLYSNTREEREHMRGRHRLHHNRLLAENVSQAEEGQVETEAVFQVASSIKNLCQTLDALVFVVDAGQDVSMLLSGRAELKAMLREMWSAPEVPVLVLSCVQEYTTKRMPAVDVAEYTQLGQLNRPWQVHDCVVDSLAGLQQAFQWVVEQTQRR